MIPPRVEAILDAFRGCTNVPEVNACARDHAEEVAALNADPETRVFAFQIRNMAAYRRLVLIHHK
ncbi:hypothetical protein [Leisingera sp.]|uniref:hypothetical protein n=1 Tax=Leisingera sp. TaxID=1879318 RepID=UPI002B27453A|nr:hypothetical protein [Leisingera sp.]